MRLNPAKWVIPGLLTVVLGTAGAVQFSKPDMEADLSARTTKALADAGFDWANVRFEARDAVLGGVTTDATQIKDAGAIAAKVYGVRTVEIAMDLAPLAKPYIFSARVRDGVVLLSGGVPDSGFKDTLARQNGVDASLLELRSGVPARESWHQLVDFALRQIAQLDEGEVRIADLKLSIDGRAKSREAFDMLQVVLDAGFPTDAQRGDVSVRPPVQSPFEWSAKFDGETIELAGFSPDEDLSARMRTMGPKTARRSGELLLASGAPDNFGKTALRLLDSFDHVERGTARINGSEVSFTGAPSSPRGLVVLTALLKTIDVDADLEPPLVTPYQFTAARSAKGVNLTGYVPNPDILNKWSNVDDIKTGSLQVGRGAPAHFDRSVSFGLAALEHLETGRFALKDDALQLAGRARTPKDFKALGDLIETGAPAGAKLDIAQLQPAIADPFLWSAVKSEGGNTVFDGFVPSVELRSQLVSAVGEGAIDVTSIALGAPDDFAKFAALGLSQLGRLEAGTLDYDGAQWRLSGTVQTADIVAVIETTLASSNANGGEWIVNLTAPEPTPMEPAPTEATPAVPTPTIEIQPEVEPAPAAPESIETAELTPTPEAPAPETPEMKPTEPSQEKPVAAEMATEIAPPTTPAPEMAEPKPEPEPESMEKPSTAGVMDQPKTTETQAPKMQDSSEPATTMDTPPSPSDDSKIAMVKPEMSPESDTPASPSDNAKSDDPKTEMASLGTPDTTTPKPASTPVIEPKSSMLAIAKCRSSIAVYTAHNTILFDAGSDRIAAGSTAIIDALSGLLQTCPSAIVHVEGHTDADGDDTLNMALSVLRAEAVLDALTERGVDTQRLYAVGFGESLPIATNDTRAGKRANRRIVFTILDKHS